MAAPRKNSTTDDRMNGTAYFFSFGCSPGVMNRHSCQSTTGRARARPPQPATLMRMAKPSSGPGDDEVAAQAALRRAVAAEVLVGPAEEVEDRVVEQEHDDGAGPDGEDRLDEAVAQLTEVLGERHLVVDVS